MEEADRGRVPGRCEVFRGGRNGSGEGFSVSEKGKKIEHRYFVAEKQCGGGSCGEMKRIWTEEDHPCVGKHIGVPV